MDNKLIKFSRYRENARKLSVLYKHQMNKPLDVAIFWTEYILKFKTAQHLNLPTRNMNFIESTNFDLMLIFLLSLVLVPTLFCSSIYFIFRCINTNYDKRIESKKRL